MLNETVIGRPAPQLRPFVDRYAGFRYAGLEPGLHHGLPSRHVMVMISLSAPVDIVAMPDPAQAPGRFAVFAGGLHTAPATISLPGSGEGISIDLSPLGTRALLGVPAAALAEQVVEGHDLWGGWAAELADRVHEAPEWSNRFELLDEVLTARLGFAGSAGPLAEVARAWQLLLVTRGVIGVAALAADVGWSRRHLSARFRAEFGVSPKAASRVLRFDRACDVMDEQPRLGLAEVAARCGYADQAHLTREWHQLAGTTPTGWLADELRDHSSQTFKTKADEIPMMTA